MKSAIAIAALLVALAASDGAWAQQTTSTTTITTPPADPGNSTPGIDRYLANPGRQQATEVGAQCGSGAGSGAFGFFGKDNNLAGGADGTQTGLNNSAVCGNRQGNLP
jgi:hypothetical protein